MFCDGMIIFLKPSEFVKVVQMKKGKIHRNIQKRRSSIVEVLILTS